MAEGNALYTISSKWYKRDDEGKVFTVHIPEPVGSVYHITGEAFRSLLESAGFQPSREDLDNG